jgi:hypothetical protein
VWLNFNTEKDKAQIFVVVSGKKLKAQWQLCIPSNLTMDSYGPCPENVLWVSYDSKNKQGLFP